MRNARAFGEYHIDLGQAPWPRARAEFTIARKETTRMDMPWLASYPADVPHEINPDQYGSLTQVLEESFRKNAARPFSVCMERWMTYGQLDELSAALGAWLQAQGLEPG